MLLSTVLAECLVNEKSIGKFLLQSLTQGTPTLALPPCVALPAQNVSRPPVSTWKALFFVNIRLSGEQLVYTNERNATKYLPLKPPSYQTFLEPGLACHVSVVDCVCLTRSYSSLTKWQTPSQTGIFFVS